jgi:hypothetical protein
MPKVTGSKTSQFAKLAGSDHYQEPMMKSCLYPTQELRRRALAWAVKRPARRKS